MIFIQIGITLIFLLFSTLMILKAYKKLNKEEKEVFKRELIFETGILYVGYLLLFISGIFLNPSLRNLSVFLILVGWFYQGILIRRKNRKRSMLIFVSVLIAAYIYFIYLN